MPKSTFYRLPEEKRHKILAAAQNEFLNVSYREVSINRIIKDAGIPRGSFYQYFEDKRDLFLYIMQVHKEELFDMVSEQLKEQGGDLFECVESIMNRFIEHAFDREHKAIRILFEEPWIFEMMWEEILYDPCCSRPESSKLVNSIDRSLYDVRDDEEYMQFLRLFGTFMRESVYNMIIRRTEDDPEVAKQQFFSALHSFRRHYIKKTL